MDKFGMMDEFDKIAQQILSDVASAHAEMIAADIPWLASVPAIQKNILMDDAANRIAAAIRTAVATERERCARIAKSLQTEAADKAMTHYNTGRIKDGDRALLASACAMDIAVAIRVQPALDATEGT